MVKCKVKGDGGWPVAGTGAGTEAICVKEFTFSGF